jgi:hypothetical protein
MFGVLVLIKDQWLELSQRRQKEKAKERPKQAQPTKMKKKGKN